METFAFEQITVGTVVATFTGSVYGPGDFPQCEGGDFNITSGSISYRLDGEDPTSLVGHVFAAGDDLRSLSINEIRKFRAVRIGDSDAKVAISYKL